jgi:hypothetical protein
LLFFSFLSFSLSPVDSLSLFPFFLPLMDFFVPVLFHIELTEEREEEEVIDSENENEGKHSEQNEKQNTLSLLFAFLFLSFFLALPC